MKSVTDNNIDSPASKIRRNSFDRATDLKSRAHVEIILEGILFDAIRPRLNADHEEYFETAYRVDNSAKGVTGYNIIKAIDWLAKKESEQAYVIILTENEAYYTASEKVIRIKPSVFLEKIEKVLQFADLISGDREFKEIYLTNALASEFFKKQT